jgi:histidine triad (HIT) family protein
MDCLFCKFVSKEIPVPFVHESENIFAINDIDPQAPMHVLLIPKVHFENGPEVAKENSETIAELFTAAKKIAEERDISDFRTVFNTGAQAGQSVFHAHLHLLGGRMFTWPPG